MRVLVVGAGAVGGYFGGRLMQAGRDVTFLVRPGRAAQLAAGGLIIQSAYGDVTLREPATILAQELRAPFDVVVLSCKAYDLAAAIDAFAPAVGPETMILPLLNGMRHLDLLDARFGPARVLGGLCAIGATLNAERAVVHLNDTHSLAFGERDGGLSDRVQRLAGVLVGAGFDARPSARILHDMWEKWVFLTTLAGITCLMRAPVGDILAAPGGDELIRSLLGECAAIAEAEGFAPRAAFLAQTRAALTAPGSTLNASMMRDIEGNAPIEADHIAGDLLRRRGDADQGPGKLSLLGIAYTHMKAYEARRVRTLAAAANAKQPSAARDRI